MWWPERQRRRLHLPGSMRVWSIPLFLLALHLLSGPDPANALSAPVKKSGHLIVRGIDLPIFQIAGVRIPPYQWWSYRTMASYSDYLGKTKLLSGYPVSWTGLSGAKGDTLVGTNANEIFYDKGSNKFIGNGGDDIYQVVDGNTAIVEQTNGGNDSIRAFGTYRAPANVEIINLFVTAQVGR